MGTIHSSATALAELHVATGIPLRPRRQLRDLSLSPPAASSTLTCLQNELDGIVPGDPRRAWQCAGAGRRRAGRRLPDPDGPAVGHPGPAAPTAAQVSQRDRRSPRPARAGIEQLTVDKVADVITAPCPGNGRRTGQGVDTSQTWIPAPAPSPSAGYSGLATSQRIIPGTPTPPATARHRLHPGINRPGDRGGHLPADIADAVTVTNRLGSRCGWSPAAGSPTWRSPATSSGRAPAPTRPSSQSGQPGYYGDLPLDLPANRWVRAATSPPGSPWRPPGTSSTAAGVRGA